MTRRSARSSPRPASGPARATRHPFVRVALERLEDRTTPALFNPMTAATSSFSNASWAVLGKFNADSNLDMAVASYTGNAVTVVMGNGDGTFGGAISYPIGGTEANFVDAGDFNGDGKTDLVATVLNNLPNNGANPGKFHVLLGDGAGGFTAATGSPFDSNGRKPYAVVVAELTGDTNVDLAICHFGASDGSGGIIGNNVSIFQGKGDGTFNLIQTITNGLGFNPTSIAAGDFDSDGDQDLVVCEVGIPANVGDPPVNGSATVITNNGSGSFALTTEYDSGGIFPVNVRVANVAGPAAMDAKLDIVVANAGDVQNPLNFGAGDGVTVLINGGTGAFGTSKTITSDIQSAFAVAPADYDADGDGDIAVANLGGLTGGGFVSAFTGNGTGTFTAASGSPYPNAGVGGGQVAVSGDLDNNGSPDVVLLGDGNKYLVYLNTTVQGAATATALTSVVPTPSTYGQAVTFTATVTTATGTPTGTVSFLNGTVVIGTAPLADVGGKQVATLVTAPTQLAAGAYSLTARYEGEAGKFASSTSAPPVAHTVNKAATATTLTAAPPNPVLVGTGVTLTATVAGPGVPAGFVAFFKGVDLLGQTKLSDAGGQQKAAFAANTTGWAAGDYAITAKYAENLNWLASESVPYTLTITTAPAVNTTITITSAAPSPSLATQPVTITARVTAPAGLPTGTVQFFADGTLIGSGTLAAGAGGQEATAVVSTLGIGAHTFTANYLGAAGTFNPSQSVGFAHTVTAIGTTITVTSSGSPSFVTQPVTFTAVVGSQFGPAAGTVAFFDGGVPVGSAALATVNGQQVATFVGVLAPGAHTVTAKFAAQGNFSASETVPITQVVNQVGTTTAVATSLNPATEGQAVTFTATVTGTVAIAATPTGTVTFFVDGIAASTAPVAGGAAAFTTSTLAPGTHAITASFSGDTNFTASTAGAVSQVVNPTVPPPPPPPSGPGPELIGFREFAVGAGAGHDAEARFFNPDSTERFRLNLFPGLTGGVRVTSADFNGDGIADMVAGTGPGSATLVRVLDGKTQAELFRVAPFEARFVGGVYVSSGDVTGDGVPDFVVSPDEGGGPRIQVYSGNGFVKVDDFFGIDDTAFRGGARSGIGDLDGDGVADLVVAAGFGGGPRVAAFDGQTLGSGNRVKLFADFFAFESRLRNGTFVAAGDVDGDGFADLIAGGGPGGGPRVTVFGGGQLLTNRPVPIANFFGGDVTNRGGVRVAARNLDGDAKADLVIGAGTGAGSRVTAYAGKRLLESSPPPELFAFDAFPGFAGGVYVG
ncbi:MAG TPA: Ig-like domain repeat protein [Fimbriiglobus sp.]|nr:Ig-like domain repeat protein [Fimbriiglobus sp.]